VWAGERRAGMRGSGNDFGDFQSTLFDAFSGAVDGVRLSKWLHDWVVSLLSNPSCEFNGPEFWKNVLAEFEEEALLSSEVGLDESDVVACWRQDPVNLTCGGVRIFKVFHYTHSNYEIKGCRRKRQLFAASDRELSVGSASRTP